MVRAKKVTSAAMRQKEVEEEESASSLMVQSRSRRTIKPNPRYNSQEMIPLKRIGDSDDDDDDGDLDGSQNAEDDEDFRDDGAKDSDVDESPPVRRRGGGAGSSGNGGAGAGGRVREAPRSEPQPQRRLQQIRAGFKEATMSTSKLMQKSGLLSSAASSAMDKKRKIDFDEDANEPSSKRRPGATVSATSPAAAASTPIATRGGTRLSSNISAGMTPKSGATTATGLGKENASVVKKIESQAKPSGGNHIKATPAAATTTPPPQSGITTRRQQATVSTSATTPTAKTSTATGIVRSQVVIGSAGGNTANRSMIQVRRATPMNNQTASSGSPSSTTPSPSSAPKTLASKERVILNRTPVVKPKPPAPVAQSTATPAGRTLATRSTALGPRSSPGLVDAKTPVTRILNSSLSPAGGVARAAVVRAEAVRSPDTGRLGVTEKRFVVRVQPEEEVEVKPSIADHNKPSISLFQLRSQIRSLKMPTERWSYQMKLHAIRGKPDPTTEVPDKPGYMVHSVILNRLVQEATPTSPQLLNGQKVDTRKYDRSVELTKNQYNVLIDGRAVRLLGAPNQVADKEDVETLLKIVDHVSIKSPIVQAAAV